MISQKKKIDKIMNLVIFHVCVFTVQQSGFSLAMVGRIYDSVLLKNSLMVVLGRRGSCIFLGVFLCLCSLVGLLSVYMPIIEVPSSEIHHLLILKSLQLGD
jgi:hypothetical protein